MDQTTAYEEFFDRFYPGNKAMKEAVDASADVKRRLLMDISRWFKHRHTSPLGLPQHLAKVRDMFEGREQELLKLKK